jgi:protein tyrosine/serine phosphatase
MWLPTIDSPLIPIPMRVLRKGAQAALEVIEQGGAVYAHCSKGRHRGVVMGACILVAQGMAAEQAMRLIKEHRPIADPYAWYIRHKIVKFKQCWNDKKLEELTKGC